MMMVVVVMMMMTTTMMMMMMMMMIIIPKLFKSSGITCTFGKIKNNNKNNFVAILRTFPSRTEDETRPSRQL